MRQRKRSRRARSAVGRTWKARRAAEAQQAEIEASQPEEKKQLAAIKGEIQSLMERGARLQKDLGRLEGADRACGTQQESGRARQAVRSAERLAGS